MRSWSVFRAGVLVVLVSTCTNGGGSNQPSPSLSPTVPAAGPDRIYVDKDKSGTNCGVGGTDGTFANPVKELSVAVACSLDTALHAGSVEIILLCTAPVTQTSGMDAGRRFCDYSSAGLNQMFKPVTAPNKTVTLRGEPEGMVRILQTYVGTETTAIVFRHNWAVSGVVFSAGTSSSASGYGGGFIRLLGNNVIFSRNEVYDTASTCITMAEGGDQATPANPVPHYSGITIAHNYVHDCHGNGSNLTADTHCIYNRTAEGVTVAYNDVTRCGGDGYQIENHLVEDEEKAGFKPDPEPWIRLPEVALNNSIIGNKFYTSASGNFRWGENGVDIKRAGAGLIIRDNVIWGFRQSKDHSVNGHGTGSGDLGFGIVVHGRLEVGPGTPNTGAGTAVYLNGPACDGTNGPASLGGRCALIEGNDVSDSGGGIAVGNGGEANWKEIGKPRGVDVRGNYIHDLRNTTGTDVKAHSRGVGISLSTLDSSAGTPDATYSHIYRNIVVNAPGESVHVDSLVTPAVQAYRFSLRNNVFIQSGTGSGCSKLDQYPQEHSTNYWRDAPQPPQSDEKPLLVSPFRSAAPTGVAPPSGSCGDITLAPPKLPSLYEGIPYDYRIDPSLGDLRDQALPVNNAAFGERHTDMAGRCDSAYDVGPDEPCKDLAMLKKVYMRETTSNSTRDEEIFSGGPNWWSSPDIGMWNVSGSYPAQSPSDPQGEKELLDQIPHFKTGGTPSQILVRVRSSSATAPGPVRIRVWGAPLNTGLSFPRAFTLYVNEEVNWPTASNPKPAHWVDGGTSWNVYAFDWSVAGATQLSSGTPEHFCLRAEISTAEDRRPHFTTPVYRSNNIAQRNVHIVREPASVEGFLFNFAAPAGQATFMITNNLDEARAVYLYIPENPLAPWQPGQEFPPQDGQLILLTERESEILVEGSPDGLNLAQVLIDSGDLGPPSAEETIAIEQQGAAGLDIRLGGDVDQE
jgi:hypothetical protein